MLVPYTLHFCPKYVRYDPAYTRTGEILIANSLPAYHVADWFLKPGPEEGGGVHVSLTPGLSLAPLLLSPCKCTHIHTADAGCGAQGKSR